MKKLNRNKTGSEQFRNCLETVLYCFSLISLWGQFNAQRLFQMSRLQTETLKYK